MPTLQQRRTYTVAESGKREKCNNEAKCTNCQLQHNSFSKQSALYKKEYAIQKIKITQKKSINEARREYERQNQLPTTYAKVIKPCNCECKCQENANKILTTKEKITADLTPETTPISPVR